MLSLGGKNGAKKKHLATWQRSFHHMCVLSSLVELFGILIQEFNSGAKIVPFLLINQQDEICIYIYIHIYIYWYNMFCLAGVAGPDCYLLQTFR